jgi:ethanolamine transporter EutH
MLYVPLGVLAATVTIPLASMLNGPVVNGVTLVLVVVAAMPLTYHLSMRSMPLLPYWQQLPVVHCIYWLFTTTMAAVSQFAGLTFNPVDGLAS